MDEKDKKVLLKALSKLSGKKGKYVYPSNFVNAYDYIVSEALSIDIENISEKIRETVLSLIREHKIDFSEIEFVPGG